MRNALWRYRWGFTMGWNAEYSEPFAVQETYADDVDCEIKDDTFFLTFLREIKGERIAVHRAIMSLRHFLEMRKKTSAALASLDPPPANLVKIR